MADQMFNLQHVLWLVILKEYYFWIMIGKTTEKESRVHTLCGIWISSCTSIFLLNYKQEHSSYCTGRSADGSSFGLLPVAKNSRWGQLRDILLASGGQELKVWSTYSSCDSTKFIYWDFVEDNIFQHHMRT
jgi:hypothetical protein